MKKIIGLVVMILTLFSITACADSDDTLQKHKYDIWTNSSLDHDIDKSDITADSWYHCDDNPYFNFDYQNCLIVNMNKYKVGYYPVCKRCHKVSGGLVLRSPEYEEERIYDYTCWSCKEITRVELKLSS